jgi:glycosyltransferase involved in cell wall biosynthesis
MGKVDASGRSAQADAGRRKILFVLPSLRGGGTERVMTILLRHLDRSRFEPHLALLDKAGPYLAEIPADVPVDDLKVSRVRYALPRILRVVRRLRPHAVLSALCELNLAAAFAKPFFPRGVRLYLQEVTSLSAHLAEGGKDTRVMRWVYRRLYSRADRIICKADYILDDLARHFCISPDKMIRIYNPLDIFGIRKQAEECPNPLEGDGPHLVAAGRLARVKGFDVLIDALARVRKTIPARLTLLGDGALEMDLKNQANRVGLAGAVRFAGFQKNPYPYLKHADLFVLSSRYEGLPAVILEAMALGTPAVAVDCPGGVREILKDCKPGWLVPQSDAEALARGIIAALQSRAEDLSGKQNLERALDKFRLERIMKQYEDLL